jgi:NhaA family Na+:H+ antiporter
LIRLQRDLDPERDHVRGRPASPDAIQVVGYQDFLCPYCRRLRGVYQRLRETLGDRLVYAFRHFPKEQVHPGAELAARAAEAAALQGRFFDMHDRLFDHEPPIARDDVLAMARDLGLDVDRFAADLESDDVRARVAEDIEDGRNNGVTGTPTLFADGVRYDGAWDYHSLLESLERPVAARVQRSARVFASLPTSAGLILLATAALALVCANTPLASLYDQIMGAPLGFGPARHPLVLTVREWCAEGLMTIFFLLVGLEIRREMTRGALVKWRAALLPIVAACGGVVAPALIYLAFNRGAAAGGWAIPTATDVAFTLALLAVLGARIPTGLRVFVASLAVVDDILSMVTLAVFYPREFAPVYALAVAGVLAVLIALNRARVYVTWPYVLTALALWLALHAFGVHAALAGVLLAMCLPTQPPPSASLLLAQAATALSELEHEEREAAGKLDEGGPVWSWAARNLSAASSRFASPADRIEHAVAPWSTYLILPAFAFSASGVALSLDFSSPDAGRIFAGIVAGLIIGKPLGVLAASWLAIRLRLAALPEGVGTRLFVGAACLCGVADTMALLMADRALAPADASVAKLAVLVGTVLAGVIGTAVLRKMS